jgi:23S rRNA (adenine2503-C2)-methyltransferase
VSTVGLVPAIDKLTEEGLQVTLALSLHAPDDELRDTLVPVNTRWPVREVLAAAFAYTRRTGRRLSIEYALIRDVNDQPWRPDLLAKRLAGKLVTSTSSRSTRRRARRGTPRPRRRSRSSCGGCAPAA